MDEGGKLLYRWVRNTSVGLADWGSSRRVWCIYCRQYANGTHFPNVKRHGDGDGHKKREKERTVPASGNVLTQLQGSAAKGAPAKVGMDDARALMVALAAPSASKTALPSLLGEDSLVFKAAALLNMHGHGVTKGTVAPALSRGVELMEGRIRELLRPSTREVNAKTVVMPRYVALGADEATTKIGGGHRPMVIIIVCAELGKSFCVDLVFSEEDEVESGGGSSGSGSGGAPRPSAVAAKSILAALKALDLTIDQVTCFVGDNANFNDAVAEELGVPRLRCIPHSLALVFHKLTAPFTLFATCTSGLSALMGAGGGTSRKESMRKADLNVSRMHCVVTRWCSLQHMAQYLLELKEGKMVFDLVRGVMKDCPAFQPPKKKGGAAAVGGDGDADDAELQVQPRGQPRQKTSSVIKAVGEAFEVNKLDALRSHEAKVELCLVNLLGPQFPAAMTLFSSNLENMDWKKGFELLALTREALVDAGRTGCQKVLVLKAISDAGLTGKLKDGDKDYVSDTSATPCCVFLSPFPPFPLPPPTLPPDHLQLLDKYQDLIKEASEGAIEQYDKYLAGPDGSLMKFKSLLRFHPKFPPVPMPQPEDDRQWTPEEVRKFFGHCPEDELATAQLPVEWAKYCEKWATLDGSLKDLPMGVFWGSNKVMQHCRFTETLSKMGRWHANTPASNVEAERAFGQMRTLDDGRRNNLSTAGVREEVLIRCNKDLIEELLKNQLSTM
jgi:hypothetical protein